ncbi:hypothetical protein CVT24_010138 [Panaeolus cyanescens]|uniref:F-box domain-containing protein n=1 Tax=Panaeolus cyanescens TaxID=181874 RepID=A0A409W9L0_9AGAR|nr:hypothetical protein CVT24_010138 [Panaeolus cyanescens]
MSFRQDKISIALRRELGKKDLGLQLLALYQPDFDSYDTIEFLNPLLASLTTLQRLRFHLDFASGPPGSDTFPDQSTGTWAKLTVLSMGGCWVMTDLWPVFLTACPNLQTSFFSLCDSDTDSESYNDRFDAYKLTTVHQNLKKLLLSYCVDGSFSVFTDRRFPAVTTLKIQFFGSLFNKFVPFSNNARIAEVFPAVQHLSLFNTADIKDKDNSVFPFIQRIQTLTHLSISLSPTDVPLLTILFRPQGEVIGFPKLHQVDLIFRSSAENKAQFSEQNKLEQDIFDLRNCRKTIPNQAAGPLSVSVCFTWTKKHHSKTMHNYFMKLEKKFQRENIDISVQIKEEKEDESSFDFLEADMIPYFK